MLREPRGPWKLLVDPLDPIPPELCDAGGEKAQPKTLGGVSLFIKV